MQPHANSTMPESLPQRLSRPLSPLTDAERGTLEAVIDQYAGLPVMAWWRVPEIILLKRVPMAPPILDLGCGDGRIAEVAGKEHGTMAVGLDRSPRETLRARRRGAHRLVVRADLRHPLPLRDECFSTVLSNSVFEHVAGVEPLFAEIRRVLKPGGRLVLTVPSEHLDTMLRLPRHLERILGFRAARLWQRWWDAKLGHVNLGGEPYWRRLLEESGFRVVACRPMLNRRLIAHFERWQLLHDLGLGRLNVGSALRALTEAPERVGWKRPISLLKNRTRRKVEDLLAGEPCDPGANLLLVADLPAGTGPARL
jgi:SAM-dependent methyltransferase